MTPRADHYYLDLDDALTAAAALLGYEPAVRDYGLLESALARPRTTIYGHDAYPTLDEKAAALLLSLVGNHSLLDGNKRLGWVATRLFYDLNESPLRVESADAVVELVMSIADGSLTDVAVVARRLRDWRRQP